MAETREITLIEENQQKIETLLARIPDSEFPKFCLMDEIVEEVMEKFKERPTRNQ